MKVNFNLGGTLHLLQNNPMWYGAKSNTMLVGADVTHPTSTSNATAPSVAGVVATADPENAHYLASARLQDKNQEVRHFLPMS